MRFLQEKFFVGYKIKYLPSQHNNRKNSLTYYGIGGSGCTRLRQREAAVRSLRRASSKSFRFNRDILIRRKSLTTDPMPEALTNRLPSP